jgi:threonine dehydrogenase-like Zn-dependent dehydrogenase
MKALVKSKRETGLWLADVPEPVIGINDVLIRIHKTGICGTDLHIWKWDQWAQKTIPVPMVVGHEYAGVVTEIGSHVRTVKVGDRVSGEGHLIGMKSRMARAGQATVAEIVLARPWEAESMSIADLLMSQHRWGRTRCRRFLASIPMLETKSIGSMTERQRNELARRLSGDHERSFALTA